MATALPDSSIQPVFDSQVQNDAAQSCKCVYTVRWCYPAFYLVLNHPTFNQIKKKHGINYSDKFYIRLLYAVSFVLSYSLPHKKIAGLTLEKSGLLLLTHR